MAGKLRHALFITSTLDHVSMQHFHERVMKYFYTRCRDAVKEAFDMTAEIMTRASSVAMIMAAKLGLKYATIERILSTISATGIIEDQFCLDDGKGKASRCSCCGHVFAVNRRLDMVVSHCISGRLAGHKCDMASKECTMHDSSCKKITGAIAARRDYWIALKAKLVIDVIDRLGWCIVDDTYDDLRDTIASIGHARAIRAFRLKSRHAPILPTALVMIPGTRVPATLAATLTGMLPIPVASDRRSSMTEILARKCNFRDGSFPPRVFRIYFS
jgi:hypothetical protein